jgi:hypothetical protein
MNIVCIDDPRSLHDCTKEAFPYTLLKVLLICGLRSQQGACKEEASLLISIWLRSEMEPVWS